jgi:esterase/lipase superfamily enzyme
MERVRANGWSPLVQKRFIYALSVMGSVGAAAKAVGMGRASAYKLKDRLDAASFAAAWDHAHHLGRWRQYDVAMEQAISGVTTIRVHRGGSVSVRGGPDMRLVNSALRETPVAPNARS